MSGRSGARRPARSIRLHRPMPAVVGTALLLAAGLGAVQAKVLQDDPSRPLPPPEVETAGSDKVQMAGLPGVGAKLPSCVPGKLAAVIGEIEHKWGEVEVISTHRPGARVRGTGRQSKHADCRAIDFRPPRDSYRAVASWLKANHAGGVGTYSGRHNHIHIDDGGRYRWHN